MSMKMRYIVEAVRNGGLQHMTMCWDTEAEWLSCAKVYESQGWTVHLKTCLQPAW